MRARKVLLVILGLTACICWASGNAVAEQPGNRAASGAGAQTAPSVGVAAPTVQTGDKPAESAEKVRPNAIAPASVKLPQGETGGLYPDAEQAPVPEGIPVAATEIFPVPADAPSFVFYVDVAAGEAQGGPRDAGLCVPEGGVCGPIVYKNIVQEHFNYYTTQTTALDDVYLDGTERDICSIAAVTYGVNGTYTYTLELWTDCPLTVGSRQLGPTLTSPVLPAGRSTTTFSFPGVHVPSFFWIKSVYTLVTATGAGPLLTELAEIGYTDDRFGKIEGNPPACNFNYWFSGGPIANPWSGFGYEIWAAGTTVGKCCYNNCTQCVETTYGDCMQRAGSPEFLLGATCSELPNCGKGACCLTTGVCVANKTLAECQALPNYQANSWQVGTDCTAHGVVKAADCAPVPANDLCANAISLSGTCLTVAYNNRNATYTTYSGDTVTCLRDPADPNNDVPITNDIWYFYQIPNTYETKPVTEAKVIINTLGSKYDTILAVYAANWGTDPAPACGESGAITCADADVVNGNIVGCNDDIVGVPASTYDPLHEQVQASYVVVSCDGTNGPLPGGCLLIRVGGLYQAGNTAGGPGVLNIDFIPTSPDPFYGGNGVCCLTTGGCVLANTGDECTALGGYYRPTTDFYENGNPPAGFEAKAPGCCHGEFGSCQEGEYCGKPIVLTGNTWAGNVHKVTYFKFTARDFRDGDPGYPGSDPHYALTIDTCGSGFDTVLTVYKGPFSSSPFTESGDCDDPGAVVARNDNCMLDTPGAEGRVTCAGLYTSTSCVCLTVGSDETSYNLMAGNDYYIAVGKKDARTTPQRAMGIDPVPNYPIYDPVALALHINDSYANCSACAKQCCKADMDGNGVLNGKDIQSFVSVLCGPALSCLDASWCRANMNGDSVIDVADIPAFVNALLVPWVCDNADYCSVSGYCQLPSQGGGYISDMNESVKIADNFVSLNGGQVSRVCWWGFDAFRAGTTWGACTIATPADNFAIRFYTNVDNRPGTVIASYSGITTGSSYNLTKTATGNTIVGANEYKYEVQIPPVAIEAGECVWLEIVNDTGTGDCWWLWETGLGGDSRAAQYQYGYYRQITNVAMAFCLNIPLRTQACVQYCDVTCPSGGIAEGEPDCAAGYVDSYNAGCNMAPGTEQFTTIQCGQTICGKSGIFDSATPGNIERDTDWYKLVLTGTVEQHITMLVYAEFTAVAGFLQYAQNTGSGNCADLSGYITPYGTGRCTNIIVDTWVPPGTYYLFVAPDFNDPFYPDCGADYTITVVSCAACQTYTNCLTTAADPDKCPGGTGHTAEGETCGASTNNGCNQTPAAFGTITCGGKICGTSWGTGGSRDTDWYQFTLTAPKQAKATLISEFPGTVRILKVNNCATSDIVTLATAYSAGCSAATAIANLDVGTYVVWVAPGDISGGLFHCVQCTDAWIDYDLHLVCDPPVVCTAGTYCQDYHNSPSIISSDKPTTTQYKAADNFMPTVSGSITHVCWWGANALYSGGYIPCTLTTSNFNISFHLDNAGVPNTTAFLTRSVGNLTGLATGDSWTSSTGYVYPIYLYQTDITAVAVTAGTKYWISIWNGGAGNSCTFMWAANPDDVGGDDTAAQNTGTAWNKIYYDLSFCVNIACDPLVFHNQPANDECSGAVNITANINGANYTSDNIWATQAANDPPFSCYTAGSPATAQKGRKTVWFKFTAPANGSVTVDTCSSVTPFQDSVLALYTGACGSLTEVACDDNGCGGTSVYSRIINAALTPGATYYLQLGVTRRGGTTPGTPGAYSLKITSP